MEIKKIVFSYLTENIKRENQKIFEVFSVIFSNNVFIDWCNLSILTFLSPHKFKQTLNIWRFGNRKTSYLFVLVGLKTRIGRFFPSQEFKIKFLANDSLYKSLTCHLIFHK